MTEKKQFSGWDFVILIFSIFSLALLPIQMLYKGSEDILQIVDSADYVLCSFFFADFVKQFIQAKGARLAYMKYGWIDLLSSIPIIPGAALGRIFRILRILKVLRQVSKLSDITEGLFRNPAEVLLLSLWLWRFQQSLCPLSWCWKRKLTWLVPELKMQGMPTGGQ